ncbi:MAG: protein rep [Acidobacteria bacterium]|nr:protein rep [Acidobacteriota bacterium]
MAVPVGCNHRLCPLCNSHRAARFRERVGTVFPSLRNPHLLTLTVPNVPNLSKQTFAAIRGAVRAFLRENKVLLTGGVYSIECTWNKQRGDWHPHVHMLVDINDTRKRLRRAVWMDRKLSLEYSWLRITTKRWKRSDYAKWRGKVEQHSCPYRSRDAWGNAINTELVAEWKAAHPESFIWNQSNRRVVDYRRVTDPKKAAYEVLKYMTKVVGFVDEPAAVGEFLRAVKGVRAIQTFGSCYGIAFDDDVNAEKGLKCGCGQNIFERIGAFGKSAVMLTSEGWRIKREVQRQRRCRGSSTRE